MRAYPITIKTLVVNKTFKVNWIFTLFCLPGLFTKNRDKSGSFFNFYG